MEIISGTEIFSLDGPGAVAIGKFDGLHAGHRKLLDIIIEEKEKGRKACVFTFDPAPAVFLGKSDGKELTTKDEKRLMLEQMGIDVLVEFPMNARTAAMEPEAFVKEVLMGQLKTAVVVAGTDVTFGARGAGNADLLERMAPEGGFQVKLIHKVCVEGREVSSTYVREAVEQGHMELAAKLLGRPYMISGAVMHGRKLGRTLGIPTVNLALPDSKLLPPFGVYFSRVIRGGQSYPAVTNIGCKPTVSGHDPRVGVESYIYDFQQDIYGEEISVQLCAFQRGEQRFASVEALQAQMMQDLEAGRKYFQNCRN